MGKMVIIAAPSGAGKTTIVRHLLKRFDKLGFSVSATTRKARPSEIDGKDYYFISREAFEEKIAQGAFVEWEEVYAGQYYGTLRSEVERVWNEGRHIIFDIDVKGAMSIKGAFPPETSLSIFVKPPSLEILTQRLRDRSTEPEDQLRRRLHRVREEMTFESHFDRVLINDDLNVALQQAEEMVQSFLEN